MFVHSALFKDAKLELPTGTRVNFTPQDPFPFLDSVHCWVRNGEKSDTSYNCNWMWACLTTGYRVTDCILLPYPGEASLPSCKARLTMSIVSSFAAVNISIRKVGSSLQLTVRVVIYNWTSQSWHHQQNHPIIPDSGTDCECCARFCRVWNLLECPLMAAR